MLLITLLFDYRLNFFNFLNINFRLLNYFRNLS